MSRLFLNKNTETKQGLLKMKNMETEIKFYVKKPNKIKTLILKTGAKSQGRFLEKNIIYDDVQNTLLNQKCLLRLRQDKKNTLTFKDRRDNIENKEFKIQKELEVEVNNIDIMKLILESLGFQKKNIYEKWRETFIINNTILCLDTLPYGNFIEIEGEPAKIKNMVDILDFDWEKRIITSYLDIFKTLKRQKHITPSELTFDQFKNINIDIDIEKYI